MLLHLHLHLIFKVLPYTSLDLFCTCSWLFTLDKTPTSPSLSNLLNSMDCSPSPSHLFPQLTWDNPPNFHNPTPTAMLDLCQKIRRFGLQVQTGTPEPKHRPGEPVERLVSLVKPKPKRAPNICLLCQ